MKLRKSVEGLAVQAIMAAVYPKDTVVAISANGTVTKAINATAPIGRVTVPAAANGGLGTVELNARFKALVEIKTGADLSSAAGARVKMAAADGGTGENVVVAFVEGTDAEGLAYGVVWKGAASGAVAEVLAY